MATALPLSDSNRVPTLDSSGLGLESVPAWALNRFGKVVTAQRKLWRLAILPVAHRQAFSDELLGCDGDGLQG